MFIVTNRKSISLHIFMIVSSPGQRCELLMALINYLENFF